MNGSWLVSLVLRWDQAPQLRDSDSFHSCMVRGRAHSPTCRSRSWTTFLLNVVCHIENVVRHDYNACVCLSTCMNVCTFVCALMYIHILICMDANRYTYTQG